MLRRKNEPGSVEDEREALRLQREDAARELDRLKHELAERVRAVQEKERALDAALGKTPPRPAGQPAPHPDDARELESRRRTIEAREHRLDARERELEEREAALLARPAAEPDAEQLARIEARLTELKEAERLFLRTREELSARSEALAARERLVAQRERELDEIEDKVAGPHVHALEERLRRLEQAQLPPAPAQSPVETTQGFADGLEALKRKGTRRR